MEEKPEMLETHELRATLTLTRGKMDALLELAEEFQKQGDNRGVSACMVGMLGPLSALRDIIREEEAIPGGPERDQVLEWGRLMQQRVEERADSVTGGPPEEKNEKADQALDSAIRVLTNVRAVIALIEAAKDLEKVRPERWTNCGLAWAMVQEQRLPETPETILQTPGWEETGRTGETISRALDELRQQTGWWKPMLEDATRELSREGGLEPSAAMTGACGVIRTVQELQEETGFTPCTVREYDLDDSADALEGEDPGETGPVPIPGEEDGCSVFRVTFDDGCTYTGFTSMLIMEAVQRIQGREGSAPHFTPSRESAEHAARMGQRVECLSTGLDRNEARILRDALSPNRKGGFHANPGCKLLEEDNQERLRIMREFHERQDRN